MYRNVLLDLDDTILDFHKAERIAFCRVISGLGVEPTQEITELYSRINLSQWKLLELGKQTLEETKVNRYRILFEGLGIDASPEAATSEYERLLGIGHYFVDGAEQLLRDLHGKYRLYIASNGTPGVQHSRIDSAGIMKYLDGLFISAELGANKPSMEFFDKCFAQIPDFRREETVIVGDSLTSDIRGGRNAGIDTIWYNPGYAVNTEDVTPTYEVSRLEEIKDIL